MLFPKEMALLEDGKERKMAEVKMAKAVENSLRLSALYWILSSLKETYRKSTMQLRFR